MAKALLTEEEFSRAVVTRARRERPDIRVKAMGKFFLMVEAQPGEQRVVSLVTSYQTYCDSPAQRDDVIASLLSNMVYQAPSTVRGTFVQNAARIMPQVVPGTLLNFCRQDGQELASAEYVADLFIAFVLDEPERYSYIPKSVLDDWGTADTIMLATALRNLQRHSRETPRCQRFGTGAKLSLVWETFDGYDASRVLLSSELTEMALHVEGNPVIAIPHRDYLVVFGDADPRFVEAMTERVREHFESHSYPISGRLFTLMDGLLAPYEMVGRRSRVIN